MLWDLRAEDLAAPGLQISILLRQPPSSKAYVATRLTFTLSGARTRERRKLNKGCHAGACPLERMLGGAARYWTARKCAPGNFSD